MLKLKVRFCMWTFVALFLGQLSQANQPANTADRLTPYSLNRYAYRVYSQSGEDGVIEEILRRLDIKQGFFAEFGAANGVAMSNTRNLWQKGWSGAMIEARADAFAKLQKCYEDQPQVICINAFVSFDRASKTGQTFDMIAHDFFPNREVDFLSIDIDGADHLILESLECSPKVICIEGGFAWHPMLEVRVPESVALKGFQQPLPAMISIARAKGYTPVCMEAGNLFLVRNDFAYLFSQVPQDALTLWRDGWRNLPAENREYIMNWRMKQADIRSFEGDLNAKFPITQDF